MACTALGNDGNNDNKDTPGDCKSKNISAVLIAIEGKLIKACQVVIGNINFKNLK